MTKRVPPRALRESETRFKAIFENTPAGLIITDEEGVVLECNGFFANLFGATVQDYLGVNLLERIPDGPVRQNLLSATTDGKPHRYEGPYQSIVTGREFYLIVTSEMPIPGRVFTVVQDLTVSKKTEKALRDSQDQFRRVVENSPLSMALVRSDGVIEYINLKAVDTFGYLPQDIPHMDRWWVQAYPDSAYREEVVARWMGLVQEALASHREIAPREYRVTCKDGRVKIVEIFGVWIADKVLVIFDDVTDRKQAECVLRHAHTELQARVRERTVQLEEAKRALELDIERRKKVEAEKELLAAQLRQSQILEAVGRLAGGVAHDFTNLLASVLACAWAAQRPEAAADEVHRELRRIQELCKQGGEVTRQLLTVARQSNDTVAPLDLREALRQVHVLLERACPKLVSVVFEVATDLPPVTGDRGLLTMAFMNVCLNARDAMPGGGTLTVRARREHRAGKPWAVVEVSDTGEGVPKEFHDRIFQPFFSTKDGGRGTGLGLPSALGTAESMGGALRLVSEPGRGSTFTFVLPGAALEQAPPAPARAEGAVAPDSKTIRRTVLVVEDEEDVARFAETVLGAHDCEVLRARTGLEALELLRARKDGLSLILLDLVLPELLGSAIYQILATGTPHIPVVFMTGRADLAEQVDPAVPVLRKPFSESELLECARRAFRGRE